MKCKKCKSTLKVIDTRYINQIKTKLGTINGNYKSRYGTCTLCNINTRTYELTKEELAELINNTEKLKSIQENLKNIG